MKGSGEKTRLRRLSSTAKLVAALGVALSVGFVAAVYAADPRLEQADGALEKAEALVVASQIDVGVPPQVQERFDRRRERAIDLINRARVHVAAAQRVVDQAIGRDSSAASPAAAGPHVKPIAMRGGGWVAGNDRTRAHVRALLPCPGEDGGFNPQPDPPAGLAIRVGRDRYVLDEITTSSCAIGAGRGPPRRNPPGLRPRQLRRRARIHHRLAPHRRRGRSEQPEHPDRHRRGWDRRPGRDRGVHEQPPHRRLRPRQPGHAPRPHVPGALMANRA